MASKWTFLTNHGHVLLCLARCPTIRVRDVAEQVGITERAVQRIIADLHEDGYLTIHKEGRRNAYRVHKNRKLRHPVEAGHQVRELLELADQAGSSGG